MRIKYLIAIIYLGITSLNNAQSWHKYFTINSIDSINFIRNDYTINDFMNTKVDSFVLKIIDFGITEAKINAGNLYKENNKISFPCFPPVSIPKDPTWNENPLNNGSWEFYLHSLNIIQYLISAHINNPSKWYISKIKYLITDWVNDNMVENPPSAFSWYDHAVTWRLENAIYAFDYLKKTKSLDIETAKELLFIIYSHSAILADNNFYKKHSNHGLYQSYILFFACKRFPIFKESEEWSKISFNRTIEEIKYSFTEEGIHVENSPGYHITILQLLLVIEKIFDNYVENCEHIKDKLSTIINNGVLYLSYLIKPNATVPLVGDTYTINKKELGHLCYLFNSSYNFKYLEYSYTQGEKGEKPKKSSIVYPQSGYAIFRDQWHNASKFDESIYLFFKSGFLSYVHRHNDYLSFILYGFGEDWLIDSGIYNYIHDSDERKYVISNIAHNTIIIDDMEMSRSSKNLYKCRIDTFNIKDGFGFVEGSHDLYPNIKVVRKIDFKQEAKIILNDKIYFPDNVNHNIKTIFNIPYDKEIVILNNNVTIKSKKSNTKLTIEPIDGRNYNIYVITGQKAPKLLGWSSYNFNEISESHSLIFETNSSQADIFNTNFRLSFSKF